MAAPQSCSECIFPALAAAVAIWNLVRWLNRGDDPFSDDAPRPSAPAEVEIVSGIPFPARLRSGVVRISDGAEPYTEFACEAQRGSARLVVASPAWADRGRAHPTMAPLDVGAWPYAVTTNDAAFASQVLDFETRRAIEAVDAVHEGALLVDLRPGGIIIRAGGRRGRAATVDFALKAAAVAGRLRGAVTQESSMIVSSDGTCRVCGVALAGATVSCGKCSTPHHRECWDYNGGCSVYACGGTTGAR